MDKGLEGRGEEFLFSPIPFTSTSIRLVMMMMDYDVLMRVLLGCCSVVGSMQLPMHGFGEKRADGDDDVSLKSGLSGETLRGEKKGRREGGMVKRLFRRKGGEDGGKGDGSS